MFWDFCELLGGITVFLVGLKLIATNFGLALNGKIKNGLKSLTKSRCSASLLGAGATALMQSSVAVNMLTVSLVENNVITLVGACAVIIGTNIGTTITAQLVSISMSSINFTAIGSLIAFLGFILSQINKKNLPLVGKMLVGFGFVFIGIKVMTLSVQNFYKYSWFLNFFLIKSPPIILLNGFFITAICQSSSVVTSMLVILATANIISLESAIYMILGANIGSCISVIFIANKLSTASKQTAVFNLVFNIIGALIFYIITAIFGDKMCALLVKTSANLGGAVANFHTVFNVIMGVITLPVLEYLIAFIKKILPEGDKQVSYKKIQKAKSG